MFAKIPTYSLPRAAALILLLTSGVLSAAEEPKSPSADAARDVLKERLTVLAEIVELQRKAYELGEVQFNSVLTAETDLLSAKLELAQTPAERITILETMVENARRLEEVVERLSQAREATAMDRLKAKAFRLRVQADLLRARAASK